MAGKDHIARIVAQDWQGSPAKEICLRILDYVYQNRFKITHLSLGSIRKMLGDDFSERDIMLSINYLLGAGVKVLEARYEFFDDDDEESIQLEIGEVKEALRTGIFVHPNTGVAIKNFETMLVMYFVPSDRLKEEYA